MTFKKRFFLLAVGSIFLLPLLFAVETEIEVSNYPPVQIQDFSNFTLASGVSFENYLNLSNYFLDYQGDNLTFYAIFSGNFSMNISSEGLVSIYSQNGFQSLEKVSFIASDGTSNTTGNSFFINFSVDNSAPKWFSPLKSKETIYQNDVVSFNTLWTDDFSLKNYTFFISQMGVWQNYSSSFTGISNSSQKSVQIIASPLTEVLWKFCAFDFASNMNCTSIESFIVSSFSEENPSGGSSGDSSGWTASWGSSKSTPSFKDLFKKSESSEFELNVNNFLIMLKRGDSITKVLEIKNKGSEILYFNLSLKNLEGFARLNENEFSLSPGESKLVLIDFFAGGDSMLGEHYGLLSISSSKNIGVPILLMVGEYNPSYSLDVDVLEKRARPGKNISALVNFSSKGGIGNESIVFYYAIKDFQGNIYSSSNNLTSVSHSFSYLKSLPLSKDISLGDYIFYSRAERNGEVLAMASDGFSVGYSFQYAALFRYSFLGFILLILLILLVTLFLKYKRNREKERLLGLYVVLKEMKNYIEKKDYNNAINSYLKIKKTYGESLGFSEEGNKKELVSSLKRLVSQIDFSKSPEQIVKGNDLPMKNPPKEKSSLIEDSTQRRVNPNEEPNATIKDKKFKGDRAKVKKGVESEENSLSKEKGGKNE